LYTPTRTGERGGSGDEPQCLSQLAVNGFMSLFAGREDADLPYYYTDPEVLSKTAGAVGELLNAGGSLAMGVGSGLTGGLLGGASDKTDLQEDAINLRMNRLCHPLPFVTICLDLLMYEDPRLFDAAIEAYIAFFMEIDTVLIFFIRIGLLRWSSRLPLFSVTFELSLYVTSSSGCASTREDASTGNGGRRR
jgi:hypothetical protein